VEDYFKKCECYNCTSKIYIHHYEYDYHALFRDCREKAKFYSNCNPCGMLNIDDNYCSICKLECKVANYDARDECYLNW
jgi:hypothetical protein